MQYTSAEAAKLLRKLNEDRDALICSENQSKSFVVATSEDKEALRPDYDYTATAKALEDINSQIMKVRHAINAFNVSHEVPGTGGLTIDQVLIALPQLNERKDKLGKMKNRLPRIRVRGAMGSNVIEYDYINYDIAQVTKDYDDISAKISQMQLELDKINNTDKMEIDVG